MAAWQNKSTDELCEAVLSLQTKEECYAFLEDICTIKEVLDISQRLTVAKMLRSGISYSTISAQTGASTATICRVGKCLNYGPGGYAMVLERMEDDK